MAPLGNGGAHHLNMSRQLGTKPMSMTFTQEGGHTCNETNLFNTTSMAFLLARSAQLMHEPICLNKANVDDIHSGRRTHLKCTKIFLITRR